MIWFIANKLHPLQCICQSDQYRQYLCGRMFVKTLPAKKKFTNLHSKTSNISSSCLRYLWTKPCRPCAVGTDTFDSNWIGTGMSLQRLNIRPLLIHIPLKRDSILSIEQSIIILLPAEVRLGNCYTDSSLESE